MTCTVRGLFELLLLLLAHCQDQHSYRASWVMACTCRELCNCCCCWHAGQISTK